MSKDSDVAALAGELRAIAEALAVAELRETDVVEATRLATEVRRLVDGPPRERWYSAGESPHTSPAARRAYLEQSPIRGQLNPVAPPIALETVTRTDGTKAVLGRVNMGLRFEGPPRGVHGGWIAALFDEVCGAAQALAGGSGVTAILKVRYRHISPLHEELRFEGWVAERRGRRIVAKATCHAGDTLTAQAQAVLVDVDFREVDQQMLGRRSPEVGEG
ncbi:MAG: PaaI family thioesterase [Myxococcota bacterium]|jgi:acyl-coenzyme A thioesterase PaaI-like protein|nr:PaaI family thioesterase [bacterium]MDP6074409.1 PaaI family thioesterase [Myxococcota bacterium]MDP7073795.1 PaaI family thioesterase [Myxococcota bacterium]MDP7300078.1 PaaI family thioesterase [Myxococcota bacterium]MDP7432690.1 PaaI family thioesterase [Myxococcota bacterium]